MRETPGPFSFFDRRCSSPLFTLTCTYGTVTNFWGDHITGGTFLHHMYQVEGVLPALGGMGSSTGQVLNSRFTDSGGRIPWPEKLLTEYSRSVRQHSSDHYPCQVPSSFFSVTSKGFLRSYLHDIRNSHRQNVCVTAHRTMNCYALYFHIGCTCNKLEKNK